MSIAAFLRGADLALWERLSKPRFVLTGPLAVQVAPARSRRFQPHGRGGAVSLLRPRTAIRT
jgi:hypothetical protein